MAKPVQAIPVENADDSVATTISERLSQELIIALVGPVGSGVSTASEFIAEILDHQFKYQVAPIIKPSAIIRQEAHRVGITPPKDLPLSEYIDKMQTAGNALREKFGGNYLVEKAVEKIVSFRTDKGGYNAAKQPLPGRRAYIVDSLKNLDELTLLRQIYGDTLIVFGIFAPDQIRKDRLLNDGVAESDVQKILDRDQGELLTFGQMTRKVFIESDFFICNDKKKDELRRQLVRFLEIIFDTSVHTPTLDESAMYEAYSASTSSACMSRQVGAAIVSDGRELISIGWNDVPKFGGGLYSEDDQAVWDEQKKSIEDKDWRCFKWGRKICHNEVRRNGILDDIAQKVVDSKLLAGGVALSQVREALAGTDVESLTEFSRSIHAEMSAILGVAREGRHSLVGATLYTTTYPCHNCARHIVAAGISTVVYVHPYAKSLAVALHNDAVTEDPSDDTRVVFRQYDGVAPTHFLRLFTPKSDRKRDGRLSRQESKDAVPIFRVPLDSPMDYESKVIAELSEKEDDQKAIRAGGGGDGQADKSV